MSLVENMSSFVGGRRRRRCNLRIKRGGSGMKSLISAPVSGGGKKKRHTLRRRKRRGHKSRKGGLSRQLVSLGLLGSVLALGSKKHRRSHHRRSHRRHR